MTIYRTIGIVLIVLGLAALVYRGIGYSTTDTVLKAGPVEVTREDHEYLPVPPVAGWSAIAIGVVILLATAKRHD